jgi:uncharacterized membrane protein YbaN (DUF454 family)
MRQGQGLGIIGLILSLVPWTIMLLMEWLQPS